MATYNNMDGIKKEIHRLEELTNQEQQQVDTLKATISARKQLIKELNEQYNKLFQSWHPVPSVNPQNAPWPTEEPPCFENGEQATGQYCISFWATL